MEKQFGRGGDSFAEMCQELLKVIICMPESGLAERHRGGSLAIRNRRTGAISSKWWIGSPTDPDRQMKCEVNATEKGQRLYRMSTSGTESRHLSSYQSRNPEKGRWGGAILGNDQIFSFSGLPELADEALLLAAALLTRRISHRRAGAIARESNNQHFYRLIDLIRKK